MAKRIVIADDVTGEFGGVVKSKLLSLFMTSAQVSMVIATALRNPTVDGSRLRFSTFGAGNITFDLPGSSMIVPLGGTIIPEGLTNIQPSFIPFTYTSGTVYYFPIVAPRTGPVDRFVWSWANPRTGGNTEITVGLHPSNANGLPDVTVNFASAGAASTPTFSSSSWVGLTGGTTVTAGSRYWVSVLLRDISVPSVKPGLYAFQSVGFRVSPVGDLINPPVVGSGYSVAGQTALPVVPPTFVRINSDAYLPLIPFRYSSGS